jgi:hypothetical protein
LALPKPCRAKGADTSAETLARAMTIIEIAKLKLEPTQISKVTSRAIA